MLGWMPGNQQRRGWVLTPLRREVLAWFAGAALAQTGTPRSRIERLKKEAQSDSQGAAANFWAEIDGTGSPLVEDDPREAAYSLVTFLWRGDAETKNVVIFDGVAAFDARDRMERVRGTNVWFKSYRVRNDARFAYNLSPNDSLKSLDDIKDNDEMERRLTEFQLDPLNTRRCPATFGPLTAEASYVELPNAPPRPWTPATVSAKGTVAATRFHSAILNNDRDLWIYRPNGFSRSGGPYALLVLFDGARNVKWMPEIFDYLIARKQIPPMVAALVANPSPGRNRELPCYQPFADCLAKELVPMMRQTCRAARQPARTVVAGSSYGGLASVYAGLRYSEIFGNVLTLSGSFWWKPTGEAESEWLTRQIAAAPKLPLRFYQEVGLMEGYTNQIASNRRMRDTLREKGYEVGYAEYNGGHSFLNWSVGTATGLAKLLQP